MRILHNYLLRQVLASLLMTVLVFTFMLLLANVLKEVLALLVNRQTTLFMAGQALLLLIPFVLVFALPMGLLTATLLVFGRFSADQELTAVRASGVSLVALITPILLLSLALTVVCAVINMQIAPQCRVAYKRLLLTMGMSQAAALLPEKTFITHFPGNIVYVGEVKGTTLKDILIYNLDEKSDKVESYTRASEGRVVFDATNNVINVQLFDMWWVGLIDGKRVKVPPYAEESMLTYTNAYASVIEEKVKTSDMTFFQLQAALRKMEDRFSWRTLKSRSDPKASRVALEELARAKGDVTLPYRVQMHRQMAFSFASVGFALLGIPLGIRAHRRETTFGIAVALLLVLLYYSFFIVGQGMDTHPEYVPHLLLWIPNLLFQLIGGVLLWRANKGN